MSKVYLKCVRVGGADWESSKDGDSVTVNLDGCNLVDLKVGDLIAVQTTELESLFYSLTPEQQQAVLDYDGPEDYGDPDDPEWRSPTYLDE